jgi:molybdenum ABC transporter ATP-binding protein
LAGLQPEVDLELPGRGVTGLFGHSGSGKTTLLRCIAGLVRAPKGRLVFRGEVWQDENTWVPTHRRSLGYVFQEASLFPHLTVMGNLRYGQKRAPAPVAAEDRVSLDQAIALLGIDHLLTRKPDRLSGGERQRVAIARALAVSPRVLLMDEPLAALDIARKQEILPYLERLHDELAIPVLYVSHAPDEVARLADHLVVMDGGRVLASGPLKETLARLDLPTAFSEDAGVVIEAVVAVPRRQLSPVASGLPRRQRRRRPTQGGDRSPPASAHPCPRREPGPGARHRHQHRQPAARHRRRDRRRRHPGPLPGAPGCRRHAADRPHHPPLAGSARRRPRQGDVGADQGRGPLG